MLPPTQDRAHPCGRAPPDAAQGARPKWLDRLRHALRCRHYSRRTEQTYCHWVKRFIDFRHVRHPAEKGVRSPMDEVSAGTFADQHMTPPVQSKNTQGTGG
jgi:hypothetical protein